MWFLRLFSLLLLMCRVAVAAEPESHVLDEGGIFSFDGRGHDELTRRLKALEEEKGFAVYFIVYGGIIGGTVADKADEFRDEWLGEGEAGLVLVCDTDERRFATSFSVLQASVAPGDVEPAKLPDDRLQQMVLNLRENVSPDAGSSADYAERLGFALADHLERLLDEQRSASSGGAGVGLFLAMGLTALLVTAIFWFGGRWIGRGKERELLARQFPDLEVSERLGAPYGGGMVREMSFKEEDK
ncbi:MAG: TPM domain-containing protein [Verrucomicrobiota bacterium JB023]|nr:TPM domain-containing protein [Verrucomicrobiota bacterium JB023]